MLPTNTESFSQRERIVIPKEESFAAYKAFSWGEHYPKKWQSQIEENKGYTGFNFWALLLGSRWFLFRKLYTVGLIFFLLEILLIVPALMASKEFGVDQTIVSGLIGLIYIFSMLFSGFFANYIYFKKAKRTVQEILNSRVPERDFAEVLRDEGGTSFGTVILASGAIMLMNSLLKSTV